MSIRKGLIWFMARRYPALRSGPVRKGWQTSIHVGDLGAAAPPPVVVAGPAGLVGPGPRGPARGQRPDGAARRRPAAPARVPGARRYRYRRRGTGPRPGRPAPPAAPPGGGGGGGGGGGRPPPGGRRPGAREGA